MAETALSTIKRTFGEYVSAIRFQNMTKEMMIKVLCIICLEVYRRKVWKWLKEKELGNRAFMIFQTRNPTRLDDTII